MNSEIKNQNERGRVRLHFTAVGLAVVALGLLFWARFIIVTNHPRTAIAEPQKQAAPARDASR